jgi:hypothetical protein
MVIKYSPLGEKPMTITVGEQPETGSAFNGTTDIAFAPNVTRGIDADAVPNLVILLPPRAKHVPFAV